MQRQLDFVPIRAIFPVRLPIVSAFPVLSGPDRVCSPTRQLINLPSSTLVALRLWLIALVKVEHAVVVGAAPLMLAFHSFEELLELGARVLLLCEASENARLLIVARNVRLVDEFL